MKKSKVTVISSVLLVVSMLINTQVAAQGRRSDVSGDASGNASGNAISYVSGDASGDAVLTENYKLANVNKKDDYADLEVGEERKDCSASAKTMYDIVLETLSGVEKDALDRLDYKYEKVSSEKSPYILMTYNYNQADMNGAYLKECGGNYTGTCSEVAITSLVEYYHRKNRDGGRISTIKGSNGKVDTTGSFDIWKKQFFRILDYAIAINAYDLEDPDGGTASSKIDNVVTKYYEANRKDLKGNRDTTFLKSKIESYNEAAKPVLGSLKAPNGSGHSVVIAGYYDIKVEYKKKESAKYKSKVYRYYVINDGWKTCYSGNDRVQYVREEYVKAIVKIK